MSALVRIYLYDNFVCFHRFIRPGKLAVCMCVCEESTFVSHVDSLVRRTIYVESASTVLTELVRNREIMVLWAHVANQTKGAAEKTIPRRRFVCDGYNARVCLRVCVYTLYCVQVYY